MYSIYQETPHTKGSLETLQFLLYIILIIYLKVRLIVFCCYLNNDWRTEYVKFFFVT